MAQKRSILCFGDSLTWGWIPVEESAPTLRYPYEQRWTGAMAARLGEGYHIIEEGLSARTTSLDDPNDPRLNGSAYLPSALASHLPLDLVIIMLGTNDLKWEGRQRALEARLGMARLIEIVRSYAYKPGCAVPHILLMSPPHLGKTEDEDFAGYFEHAIAESRNLGPQYAKLAGETNCHFFDAASVAKADPTDGVHLDAVNTRAIGTGLVPVVKGILSL